MIERTNQNELQNAASGRECEQMGCRIVISVTEIHAERKNCWAIRVVIAVCHVQVLPLSELLREKHPNVTGVLPRHLALKC